MLQCNNQGRRSRPKGLALNVVTACYTGRHTQEEVVMFVGRKPVSKKQYKRMKRRAKTGREPRRRGTGRGRK